MSDSEDSTVMYTEIAGVEGLFYRIHHYSLLPGLRSRSAPLPYLCTICSGACLPGVLTMWTMRRIPEEDQADYPDDRGEDVDDAEVEEHLAPPPRFPMPTLQLWLFVAGHRPTLFIASRLGRMRSYIPQLDDAHGMDPGALLEPDLSTFLGLQSMDACDQTHSEGISLRTTVMAQQSEIVELGSRPYVKSLKTQDDRAQLQRQPGDPSLLRIRAEPELPESRRPVASS
ncbi:hypothetical protein Tco_1067945 [Tanacetum coccineum]|uniref:Uncharacterized protein n=1 Tax=Tanacetum coccineum TaxID=301880 RepID=A0ABQ5HGE5_9ASTR